MMYLGLQYQVIDEHGRVGEMQELQVIDKINKIIDTVGRNPMSNAEIIDITKPSIEVGDFLKDTDSSLSIKVISLSSPDRKKNC